MIRIEIWDWDRVGKDELIGHFEMNKADFVKNQGISEALLMGKTDKEIQRLRQVNSKITVKLLKSGLRPTVSNKTTMF